LHGHAALWRYCYIAYLVLAFQALNTTFYKETKRRLFTGNISALEDRGVNFTKSLFT
jgi:hypothetical protein